MKLTRRELQVLRLVIFGFRNKEIAGELGIAIKTVEKHRGQLNCKLKVDCALAMARVALRDKLISIEEWLTQNQGENKCHEPG